MTSSPGRQALVIDSDPDAATWVADLLGERGATAYLPVLVGGLAEACEHLAKGRTDAVLVRIRPGEGAETVRRLKQSAPDVAVVAVLDVECECMREELLCARAQDCLLRSELGAPLLAYAIRSAIERQRLEADRLRALATLDETQERLRVALQSSRTTLSSIDRDLRYTWISTTNAGTRGERLIGRRDDELDPAEDVEELVALKQDVFRTGIGERREVRVRCGGAVRFLDVAIEPLRSPSGEVVGLTVATLDISERKRAEEAAAFLAEAAQVLASSVDYGETLRSLAQLAVPSLADWCVIDLLDGETLRTAKVVAADPEKEELLRRKRQQYPITTATLGHPVGRVLQSGRPLLWRSVRHEMLERIAQSEEHLTILQRLAPVSWMVVPLLARGRVVGTLTLTSSESGRRYDTADLELAGDFARTAALEIDNALAHRVARNAAPRSNGVLGVSPERSRPVGPDSHATPLSQELLSGPVAASDGVSALLEGEALRLDLLNGRTPTRRDVDEPGGQRHATGRAAETARCRERSEAGRATGSATAVAGAPLPRFEGTVIARTICRADDEPLIRGLPVTGTAADPLRTLNERERKVLSLAAHGYTASQIGKQLYLSPKTVETYRSRAMRKLGLETRADLVSLAIRSGLLYI
jgi:PAS domain S-box-containing protein